MNDVDVTRMPRFRTDSGKDNQEWLEQMEMHRSALAVSISSNSKLDENARLRAIKRINGAIITMASELEALGQL